MHGFPLATYAETASDRESGIECLPHNSPLASALLDLAVGQPAQVNLFAGPAVLTVLSIRNPRRPSSTACSRPSGRRRWRTGSRIGF